MQAGSTERLRIEYLPTDAPKLDPRNPRRHSDRQIKQIVHSIEAFGFSVPVLLDDNNNVIAGHGRIFAARKLGLNEIPIVRLSHLTPAQARAFSIADNRLTENSTWDDHMLGEIFAELAVLDLDFSLEATGFTMGEIDIKIEGLTDAGEGPDPDDVVPEFADQAPVTQPGDIWLLNGHRLLCGDALEASSYAKLMAGASANLIFTDPPYNVPIDGHASGLGSIRHRDFAMAAGEMSSGQFEIFLCRVFVHLVRYSVDGSIHYICMDWRHQEEVLAAAKPAYAELKNLCVWVKDNGGMGSLYRSQHELIFVFKNGNAPHQNNVQLGKYGRNRTNVWNYPSVNNFGRRGEDGNLLALHPTVKPVAMVADAILDCSSRGDIVLDPFLGSGSTLIAAERTGRLFRGIELDPLYVDTAIRRWQRHTGANAVHAVTGQTFDFHEAQSRTVHAGE